MKIRNTGNHLRYQPLLDSQLPERRPGAEAGRDVGRYIEQSCNLDVMATQPRQH